MIVISDGALLELAIRPAVTMWHIAMEKISILIDSFFIKDDNPFVRYVHTGFHCSAHDNRVWKNTTICKTHWKCFSHGKYIGMDRAFGLSKAASPHTSIYNGLFKIQKKKYSIISFQNPFIAEHAIGILKGMTKIFERFICTSMKKISLQHDDYAKFN